MRTLIFILLAGLSATANSAPLYIGVPANVMIHREAVDSVTPPAADDPGWTSASWREVQFSEITWLRATVNVPENFANSNHPSGLFLNAIASAEVWWDGEWIGRNGQPASTAEAEQPGRVFSTFALDDEQLQPGPHELVMRLSRQQGDNSVWTPIDQLHLGPWQDPLDDELRHYLPGLISGGAVALASLFLFVTGWRGRDLAALWLSAACLALLLQLGFESLRAFVNYPYPWHGPRLLAVSSSAWLFGFSLVGFLLARLQTSQPARWLFGLGLLAALPFGLVGDVATAAILLVFLAGSVMIAALAAKRRQAGALPLLVVLLLLMAMLLLQTLPFLDRWLYVGFALVLMVFFADHVRTHLRTTRERDAARLTAARLELSLLKQHLKPHFLMNTLTALAEWVEESPRTAIRMVHALADEFRTLIDVSDRKFISLDQELALCRTHLEVMSYRRDQQFALHTDHVSGNPAVPPAVLHTLIENAVTHGGNVSTAVTFHFTAQQNEPGRWRLRLDCPGAKVSDTWREGTGLAYVRARLSEAFGNDWQLTQGPGVDGGWFTEIDIPSETACA